MINASDCSGKNVLVFAQYSIKKFFLCLLRCQKFNEISHDSHCGHCKDKSDDCEQQVLPLGNSWLRQCHHINVK